MDVVEVFFAPVYLCFYIAGNQPQAHFAQDALYHVVAVFFECAHGFLQDSVAQRVHGLKGEVLQFAVNVVEPQTVGDGGIHFQCFGGDAAAAGGTFCAEGAHVVQAVGEFDDDDADVAGHSHDEFAEAFCLMGGFAVGGVEFQVFQLGESVHHFGDGFAEGFPHLFFGDGGVFQYVVHQPCA